MAGVKGIENVLAIYDDLPTGVYCWKIYPGGAGASLQNFIDECDENIAKNKDLARERLTRRLQMLQPGTYRIDFKDSLARTKNFSSIDFYVNQNIFTESSSPAIAGRSNGYVSKDEIGEIVAAALEKERIKNELEALKAENKELSAQLKKVDENSPQAAIGKLLNDYQPLIGAILQQKLFGGKAQVGVAGVNDPAISKLQNNENKNPNEIAENLEETTDLDNRLDAVLDKFEELEGGQENLVILLEKLYAFAVKNPPLYNSTKTMLQ